MDKIQLFKRAEKMEKENIYEQNKAKIGIASGLLMCYKLDEIAKKELKKIGITEDIFYKTRENVTNRGDRIAAAKYYSQFIDVQNYCMHHTADGLFIIPVDADLHENTKHIGGSYLLNKRKIEEIIEKL